MCDIVLAVQRLFHIALQEDWEQALTEGSYRISTLGRRFEEVGFIHLSFAHQVKLVADAFYRGRDDLLLVELDPDGLADHVRVEAVPGADEAFPHLYAPIAFGDVIAVGPLDPRQSFEPGVR